MKNLVKENVIDLIENSVDERGLPLFGIIETENENGELAKAYKQEAMFETEDYRKAAEYQKKLADYHQTLAYYYAAEYKKRAETDPESF